MFTIGGKLGNGNTQLCAMPLGNLPPLCHRHATREANAKCQYLGAARQNAKINQNKSSIAPFAVGMLPITRAELAASTPSTQPKTLGNYHKLLMIKFHATQT